MKSFNSFIYESDSPNNWEHTEEDYMHTINMILSEDPFTSQYGMQELDVLYEEEDKRKIAIMLVDIIKSKWGKFSNTYEMLILLERTGIVDLLDFKGSPFEDQFLLKKAEDDSFYNIFNSRNLDLSLGWRGLTEITPGIFKGLKNVESIVINQVLSVQTTLSIHKDLFKDCENLHVISITCFEIENIERGSFLHNTKLKSVTINSGVLKNVEPEAFSSNSIEEISLYECQIENLEPEVFLNCNSLKILDLSVNNLTRVPKLSNGLLEELYLDNNKIKRIEPGVFGNLKNLKTLELSSNPIEIIEEKSFLGLSNLSRLTLAALPSSCTIEPGAFFKLENLTSLDLFGAKLTSEQKDQLESELPGRTDIMFELPF